MATEREVSGWAIGWTIFAAVWMWMLGAFHLIAGLGGILEDTFYVMTPEYFLQFDATTWGWIHLIMGLVVILAGVGLYSGAVWARTLGVIFAMLSIVANFAFLPVQPVWSTVMIAAGAFVIWALTAHGRDIIDA
jgi:hypothetical protein